MRMNAVRECSARTRSPVFEETLDDRVSSRQIRNLPGSFVDETEGTLGMYDASRGVFKSDM